MISVLITGSKDDGTAHPHPVNMDYVDELSYRLLKT